MRIVSFGLGLILTASVWATAQPSVFAADRYNRDVVEVVTDKTLYRPSEPILVMLKYTNTGDSKLFALGDGKNVHMSFYVRKLDDVPATPHDYQGKMQFVHYWLNNGYVDQHSAVIVASGTVPGGKLKPGFYAIDCFFSVESVEQVPQLLLRARPRTIIQVR